MQVPSKHTKNFKPYKLPEHKSWYLAEDNDIIKLDWNEAVISPSPLVIAQITKFLTCGRLNWYPNINNTELIHKIADYAQVYSSQVQYFAGSDSIHEYILRTFLDKNDLITIVSPTYDNFRFSAESLEGIIDYFFLGKSFELDIDKLETHLEIYQPKMVYICNPNNPTGTEVFECDLQRLFTNFPEILFIVDEAYYEFSGVTAASLVNEHNNFMITRTFSKAFALASFRIGYVISCEKNISELSKIRNPKHISQFAQIAAIAALDDLEYTNNYVREVNSAKLQFRSYIEQLNDPRIHSLVMGGGNFALLELDLNFKDGLISYLEDNKVFVRNYAHVVSMEKFLRISIGKHSQMLTVSNLLTHFLHLEI